jgi:hypothetical protein
VDSTAAETVKVDLAKSGIAVPGFAARFIIHPRPLR